MPSVPARAMVILNPFSGNQRVRNTHRIEVDLCMCFSSDILFSLLLALLLQFAGVLGHLNDMIDSPIMP
jgi:hypothetical protein